MNNDKTPGSFNKHLGIKGWVYGGNYLPERYAYTLHRLTGLALVLYLVLHIFVNTAKISETSWNYIINNLFSGPLFKIFEFFLMIAFLYHAVNGLRLILTEFGIFLGKPVQPKYPYVTSVQKQRAFMWILMIFCAIFIIISGYEFFFIHS